MGQAGPKASSRRPQKIKKMGKEKEIPTTYQLVDVPIEMITGPVHKPKTALFIWSTPTKRKPAGHVQILARPQGPKKRITQDQRPFTSTAQSTRVEFSPSGFYEIQLGREQCETLISDCGIKESDLMATIQKDNEERRQLMEAEVEAEENQAEELDWDERSRFDPDPKDEMETDDEV